MAQARLTAGTAEAKPTKQADKVEPYRGRLAPSPTGLLHIGHARTFWAAYSRAKKAKGTLVMRIDDLDQDRSKPEFAEAALVDLRWLGIRWQEGPGASPVRTSALASGVLKKSASEKTGGA